MDRAWIADGILEALERADHELRGRNARLFNRVDKLKMQPGWLPWWDRPWWTGPR